MRLPMTVAQKATCSYSSPTPDLKILQSPQDCDSNTSLRRPTKQEPARKMGYYQRRTVNEANDNSLTTRRAALKPWSQRQPKVFSLHSSRYLEIVRQESKRLLEALLSQVLLVFLSQISSTGTHLVFFKVFSPIYIAYTVTFLFSLPIQLQRYGHQYLP